jgi:type IV pilus assembly protein PilQ
VESFGATNGPLIGLRATTDTRLGTITLVGAPRLVAIAEQYLRQLDLRQRQVALSVKILDVNLENDAEIANSFAFRWGNNFIVNDNGQLLAAFGRNLPATADNFSETEIITRNSSAGSFSSGQLSIDSAVTSNLTFNQLSSINSSLARETGFELLPTGVLRQIDSNINRSGSALTSSIQDVLSRSLGRNINLQQASDSSNTFSTDFLGSRRPNPGLNYPPDNFFDFVRAQIVSRNTKVIASPTLILQEDPSVVREDGSSSSSEGGSGGTSGSGLFASAFDDIDSPIGRKRGNEGVVRVGTNVPTNVTSNVTGTSATVSCTISQLSTAGLVLGARVQKIDDNGFVTFSLSPSISAVEREVGAGEQCPPISILRVRRLDTGVLRVRDGQTLILTGVISDFDRAEVSKWPILGDIPIIGQFFRASNNFREKRELVIMVTPRIINDTEGGTYGYGYQPSIPASRAFLGGMQQSSP